MWDLFLYEYGFFILKTKVVNVWLYFCSFCYNRYAFVIVLILTNYELWMNKKNSNFDSNKPQETNKVPMTELVHFRSVKVISDDCKRNSVTWKGDNLLWIITLCRVVDRLGIAGIWYTAQKQFSTTWIGIEYTSRSLGNFLYYFVDIWCVLSYLILCTFQQQKTTQFLYCDWERESV